MTPPAFAELREAHLVATLQRWGTSEFYFTEEPHLVQARVPTVEGELLIARAADASVAHLIALMRWIAPMYVASIENLLATVEATGSVTGEEAARLIGGPWSDSYSPWKWAGWDPATGASRVKPQGGPWHDEWTSPPADSIGSRQIGIPRMYLTTVAPGEWQLGQEVGDVMRVRRLVGPDGTLLANFRRAEDAEFTYVARNTALTTGPVYAALLALAKSGESMDAARINDIIATTPAWTEPAPDDAPTGRTR